MEKLAELWEDKKVRTIIILGAIALVVVFVAFSMTDDSAGQKEYSKMQSAPREGSLLGVSDAANEISSREASDMLDTLSKDFTTREKGLNAREEEMKKQNEAMLSQQQALEAQVLEMRQQMIAMAKMQGQPVNTNQQDNRNRANQQNNQGQVHGQQVQGQIGYGQTTTVHPNQVMVDQNGNVVNTRQTQIITKSPNVGPGNVIRTVTQRNIREFRDGEVKERDVKISTINQRTQRPESQVNAGLAKTPLDTVIEQKEEEESFTLSLGSIITGTLLNGVAAPTSVDRASNPMPVLMRIKKEAIMPNHFTLDIRECHMLASAIGDLSSSRAILRAEGISCITNDGKSIEATIDAYAVSSSDGMAGIEGDIVFKSGAMIANSLKAEFIRGFADAFSPKQVQSLNTSPGASQLWQQQNLDKAAGAGIGQGVSGGASRIADYYMEMAEQAHPVVELLPGIEVDFIVQRGMTLNLNGNTMTNSERNSTADRVMNTIEDVSQRALDSQRPNDPQRTTRSSEQPRRSY